MVITMKIKKAATAGSMESNDALVGVYPREKTGIEIEIDSILKVQFGDRIKKCAQEVAEELNVEAATIKIVDKGALDYALRARVETALLRAAGEEQG